MPPISEALTPAEQAHIDSGGETPIDANVAVDPNAAAADPGADDGTAAEAQPGAEGAVEGDGTDGKKVGLDALHEERRRRQALETENAAGRKQLETALARMGQLVEVVNRITPLEPAGAKPAAAAEPVIPDVEKDPVGHIVGTMAALQRQVAALSQGSQQQTEQQRQNAAVTAVQQRAIVDENRFKAEEPAYMDAVNFLIGTRDKQLQLLGMDDPVERKRNIDLEALQLADRVLSRGGSPAKAVFELAKTLGFAPKKPAAAAAAAAGTSPAEKIAATAEGQRQALSLNAVGGRPTSPLTAQRLLEMSDDDFAAAMKTAAGRAAMGA